MDFGLAVQLQEGQEMKSLVGTAEYVCESRFMLCYLVETVFQTSHYTAVIHELHMVFKRLLSCFRCTLCVRVLFFCCCLSPDF